MKIIVDADACPRGALAAALELGDLYSVDVWTVASFNHLITSPNHVVVGDGSQEVDIKVVNLAEKGDIIVTQDIGLSAIVLGKGCKALSTTGREYLPQDMPFLLEEREAKAKLRRGGGRTRGPRQRTEEDDTYFRRSLESILTQCHNMSSYSF